jgi:hypothetical protein
MIWMRHLLENLKPVINMIDESACQSRRNLVRARECAILVHLISEMQKSGQHLLNPSPSVAGMMPSSSFLPIFGHWK